MVPSESFVRWLPVRGNSPETYHHKVRITLNTKLQSIVRAHIRVHDDLCEQLDFKKGDKSALFFCKDDPVIILLGKDNSQEKGSKFYKDFSTSRYLSVKVSLWMSPTLVTPEDCVAHPVNYKIENGCLRINMREPYIDETPRLFNIEGVAGRHVMA